MQIEQAITNNMFALKLVVLPLDLLALIRFSSLGAAGPSSRARGSGVEHVPLPVSITSQLKQIGIHVVY